MSAPDLPPSIAAWFEQVHPFSPQPAYEALFGRPTPRQTLAFDTAHEGDVFLPRLSKLQAEHNVFEAAIAHARRVQEPTALLQLFSSAMFGWGLPGGDAVFLHAPQQGGELVPTVWSHETSTFGAAIAIDPASALYFEKVAQAIAKGDASDDNAAALALVADRLELGAFPYGSAWARLPAQVKPTPQTRTFDGSRCVASFLSERAKWIAEALAGLSTFVPDGEHARSTEKAFAAPTFATYMPSPLFWGWWAYLLGRDAELGFVIERAAQSPSRVVRDAIALLSDLRAGRRDVAGAPLAELPARLAAATTRRTAAKQQREALETSASAVRLYPTTSLSGEGKAGGGSAAAKGSFWHEAGPSAYSFCLSKPTPPDRYEISIADHEALRPLDPPLPPTAGIQYWWDAAGHTLLVSHDGRVVHIDARTRAWRVVHPGPVSGFSQTPHGFAVGGDTGVQLFRDDGASMPTPEQHVPLGRCELLRAVTTDGVLVVRRRDHHGAGVDAVVLVAVDGARCWFLGATPAELQLFSCLNPRGSALVVLQDGKRAGSLVGLPEAVQAAKTERPAGDDLGQPLPERPILMMA